MSIKKKKTKNKKLCLNSKLFLKIIEGKKKMRKKIDRKMEETPMLNIGFKPKLLNSSSN